MKLSPLCIRTFLAMAAIGQMALAQTRVPQITTKIGGRPAVVPQSYYDAVAAEAADPNMHPSLGPYTVTAVKSGNWSDPTLWSTGAVPGANATVDLGAHDVTYNISSTVKIKHIHNGSGGTFRRAPGSVLWVSTQMFHGKYIEGEPGAPIPSSNPTKTVYWYSDAPGQTAKFGLISMGGASMRGETKAHFLNASASLFPGATTIPLIGVSGSNWKVGDEICIAATESSGTSSTDPTYMGPTSFTGSWNGASGTQTQSQGFKNSQDEPRTITAISGDNVTLSAPLTYSHMVYSTTLPRGQNVTVRPYVVNFTRSIQHRAEVASTVLQQRPHMMFMHNDDVNIRYVDILNFGRTSTDPSLHVPTSVGGKPVLLGTTDLADTNNVRGRYGMHIHGTGPYFGRKMVVVQGVVVRGQNGPSLSAIPVPGWGITHHNSRCAIEDCVTYNVRGAGFVSELGNEIGQWVNNISIWNRGDGFKTSWSSRQETHTNHNGHMGVAYENQARGILQQQNVAISSHFGWMFHQQNAGDLVARVPDKFSLRFKDPLTEGGQRDYTPNYHGLDNDTYGIEQDQIHDFNDNTTVSVSTGFFVAHRQMTDRKDQSVMIAKRFHCINTSQPEQVANYTFYYSFYDCFWRGTGTGTAVAVGGNTHGMMWVNMKIENYATGFKDNGLGFNYNGFWIDIAFSNVATPFNNTKTYTSSVETHPLRDVMGPWTITDDNNPNPGFTAKVRTWSSIASSSLPSIYPLAPKGLSGVIPPGADTPSFTLDASSDTSTTTGVEKISLSGTIVDYVGVRKWPDGYVTFNDLYVSSVLASGPYLSHDTTGIEMVEMNGCFNDNGTWKCRLWFNLDERRDGNYLQFPIDITLTGFDTAFLNANVVDPNATKPDLPLKLESIDEEAAGGGGTPENGLVGDYFNNLDLTQPVLTRTDATVDFNWGTGSPAASVGADTFSVRWTGYVVPKHSSGTLSYTFKTLTNDGVRLWVNDQLVIDDWTSGPLRTKSTAGIQLAAGQEYPIRMEFYENTNTAEARLRWLASGLSEEIVPTTHLFTEASDGSPIVMSQSSVSSYSDQDAGNATVSGNGQSLTMTGNVWKKHPFSYTVTSNTVLRFTVNSSDAGELLGMGLDNNNTHTDAVHVIQVGGSQNNWSGGYQVPSSDTYTAGSGAVEYEIQLGSFYTGSMSYLVFIGDDDADASTNATFSNIQLFEN